MNSAPHSAAKPAPLSRAGRPRRAALWGVLVALLLVAQSLLVALTVNYEAGREEADTERVGAETAAAMRRELLQQMQALQALAFRGQPDDTWRLEAQALLRPRRGLERIEWRSPDLGVMATVDPPTPLVLFSQMPHLAFALEVELACDEARRRAAPSFSRSYFVPLPGGKGAEVMDLCVPVQHGGREAGFLVGTFALARVLDGVLGAREKSHEFSIVEADGTRLARAGLSRGANVFVARQVLDLPGATLLLRADSVKGHPSLIPNVTTALVMGLSLALFGVVLLLARDVRRRARVERALAEALAFRNAMEDSLPTGLRARALDGTVTYANPAFCAMVGFTQEELRAAGPPAVPPYWPPESAEAYRHRQRLRLGGEGRSPADAREGFETVFMRKNGERFPVVIYEAPLVDDAGRHSGWMSAVLDLSAQRRVEEIARHQQDQLQASARLATVGEMASLLSHELNQPLAAIASYASGSLNLLAQPGASGAAASDTTAEDLRTLLNQALQRIAEQADRAGRVIKSVHAFVRRREQEHAAVRVDALFEAVLPLVRLQARKNGTRVEIDLPPAPSAVPVVYADRTMVEQVLINLGRNGIQAMDDDQLANGQPVERVLTLRARQTHPRWVTLSVIDTGSGIAPGVAAQLFTPFFSTRAEGMGLGLSLCRTVIERHGGALDFGPAPSGRGTEFRFTLPTPEGSKNSET